MIQIGNTLCESVPARMHSFVRLIVTVLVAKVALSACRPIYGTFSCVNPDDLAQKLSIARIMSPYGRLQTSSGVHTMNGSIITVPEGEKKTCPSTLTDLDNSAHVELRHRSTCPYYLIMDRNPYRYPATITSVGCRCQKCLQDDGWSQDNSCEQIYVIDVVLMMGKCVDGVYEYIPTEVYIQVACTCARGKEHGIRSPSDDGPTPIHKMFAGIGHMPSTGGGKSGPMGSK